MPKNAHDNSGGHPFKHSSAPLAPLKRQQLWHFVMGFCGFKFSICRMQHVAVGEMD